MARCDPVIRRPLLRWHGGKWVLAPWIISHFPPHRTYVEPYGGAASVLLRKQPCYSEVWNDLDAGVHNLMQLLRAGRGGELVEQLRLTPFSRREFFASYEPTDDAVESARRLIVRSFMGFGSNAHNTRIKTGFRSDSHKSGTTPAKDWANYPDALEMIARRVHGSGVVVENRPALAVMADHDRPDTLHFVDPPYMPSTRSQKSRKSGERYHAYSHEMLEQDHEELLAYLQGLTGMVVLAGYPTALYDEALCGWHRVERAALADGARPRTEVLWINPAAASRLHVQGSFLADG